MCITLNTKTTPLRSRLVRASIHSMWLPTLRTGGGGEGGAVIGTMNAQPGASAAINDRLLCVCLEISNQPSDECWESEVCTDFAERKQSGSWEELGSRRIAGLVPGEPRIILSKADESLVDKFSI